MIIIKHYQKATYRSERPREATFSNWSLIFPSLASNLREFWCMRVFATRVSAAGQTLVEYALIIALLAVAVTGALTAFSGGVQDNLTDSNTSLQKAMTGN